jgi:hypothetical protein
MMFVEKPPLNQSFYSGNYTLQISDWEYILRSAITHSKTVWLRASMEFAPNIPDETRKHLEKVRDELIAAEVVKTWELERTAVDSALTTRVVTTEEQKELHHIIISELNSVPRFEFGPTSIDRGAKNVDLERDLWNLGLANYCGISSIIFNSSSSQFPTSLSSMGAHRFNLGSEFARKVFERFQIDGLWRLEPEEILEFQNSSKFYQKQMDDLFTTRITWDETYIDQCVDALAASYEAVMLRMVEKGTFRGFAIGSAGDLIVNAAGYFVPVLSFLSVSHKFYDWVKHRNTVGFVLHMYELKKLTKE